MKKTLLISAAIIALGMQVQAVETNTKEIRTANWAEMVGGQWMDISGASSVNAQGEIFVTHAANTFPDKNEFNFADTKFTGSGLSDGPNGSPDFGLYKISQDGKLIMAIHSDRGYFHHSSSPMTATSDGGCIVAFKQRLIENTDYDNGKNIMLRIYTTADPNYVYSIEEPNLQKEDGWVYKGYVVKFDKDGKVQWRRNISTDTKKIIDGQGYERSCSNMFDFEDIQQGPDGSFYVLGKYARPMTIEGAPKEFIPDNIPSNWDYDFVQHAAGDMFLTKYDAQGNYQWTLTHKDGSLVANEGVKKMVLDNEAIYIMGHFKGEAGQSTTFGDKSLTIPTSDIQHQFFMKINFADNVNATDDNIKIEYAKVLEVAKNQGGKKAIKPMFISVSDNKLMIGGGIQGVLKDNGKEILRNDMNFYHGYMFTANKADGTVLVGREFFPYNGISEVESVHLAGDSIYVSGYTLSNSGWTYSIDKETLATGKFYQTFTGGNCTLQSAVAYQNKITVFGRGRNKPFGVQGIASEKIDPGQDQSAPEYKSWEVLIANFTFEGIKYEDAGVENMEKVPEFTAYASRGCINVVSAEPCQVYVHSVFGALLKSEQVGIGTTAIEMPKGFYIVNGKKVIVY